MVFITETIELETIMTVHNIENRKGVLKLWRNRLVNSKSYENVYFLECSINNEFSF